MIGQAGASSPRIAGPSRKRWCRTAALAGLLAAGIGATGCEPVSMLGMAAAFLSQVVSIIRSLRELEAMSQQPRKEEKTDRATDSESPSVAPGCPSIPAADPQYVAGEMFPLN